MPRISPNRALISFALLLFAVSAAARGAPRSVAPPDQAGSAERRETLGIYPVELPEGLTGFADKRAAQLRDGALGLPRLGAVQKLARGDCAFDEPGCLAGAAKSAQVSRLASGKVRATPQGYSFELRLIDRDGKELGAQAGAVVGGPLDLAGGLEHGLCELMGGAPCTGTVHVASDGSDGVHVSIDGADRGPLPLPALALPVGRHLIRAGDQERRVRISYLRETQLACAGRGPQLTLTDLGSGAIQGLATNSARESVAPIAPTAAAPAAALPSRAGVAEVSTSSDNVNPRARAARVMLALGGALLMTSAGLEVYARAETNQLDNRAQGGPLTASDGSYGKAHAASVAALLIAATGAGAAATGGLVFLLAPGSAGVGGKF